MGFSLKIKDVKKIIEFINEIYNFDLSDFTYVSIKIKMEQFIDKYKITSVDDLFNKVKKISSLRNEFIKFLLVDSFELFRDPALWRIVKEEVLHNFSRDIMYKVWIPSCFQGAELLSFLILREELGMADKIQVFYSSPFKVLSDVKGGFNYEERKHGLSLSNYKRIDGHNLDEKYFTKVQNVMIPLNSLFNNTIQYEYNEIEQPFSKAVNMILYRNILLRYNKKKQADVAQNLIKSLKSRGFLILGVKESLVDDANRELFTIFNLKESIYKKKN